MSDDRFGRFLAHSFEALRRELPAAYRQLCERLVPRAVAITVDGETVRLRFDASGARPVGPTARAAITVRCSRTAILALIDAELSLDDAIMSDALELTGSPDELLAFHDALMTYVHGAVRAPSFPALLQAYRVPPVAGAMPVAPGPVMEDL